MVSLIAAIMIRSYFCFLEHAYKLCLLLGNTEPDRNLPIQTVNELKILGIVFNRTKMTINIEKNWRKKKLEKLEEIIKPWHRSIQGKIVVVVVKKFLVS